MENSIFTYLEKLKKIRRSWGWVRTQRNVKNKQKTAFNHYFKNITG